VTQLVRFAGLRTKRYEIKIVNVAAGVLETRICHHSEVQGENGECDNMINGTDHICDSLDLQKPSGLEFLLIKLAIIASCHSNSTWHKTGEGCR